MEFGTTISFTQLKYLEIDLDMALRMFSEVNFEWVRLGLYWSDIEKNKGKYDFNEIKKALDYFEKKKIKVVVTVGMKAPRWPEYYIADCVLEKLTLSKYKTINLSDEYLCERLFLFIRKSIAQLSGYKCIKAWQVENEPFDPSGESRLKVGVDVVEKEVELVKKLDPDKKIIVSFWGNEAIIRNPWKKVLTNSDVLGCDFYTKCWNDQIKNFTSIKTKSLLFGFLKIASAISAKPIWIMELQAEPWEPDGFFVKSEDLVSFTPDDFENNLKTILPLNPQVCFLWGYEYWIYKRLKKDDRFWKEACRVILKYSDNKQK